MPITIQVRDATGTVLGQKTGSDYVFLPYKGAYAEGDEIVITENEGRHYLVIGADDAVRDAQVYLKGGTFLFRIPYGNAKLGYSPKAFAGDLHLITVRFATREEIHTRRNVAENSLDQRFANDCYPHVTSNAETRGEDVFAARNVIDGIVANTSHGRWPYLTWGDNEDPLAEVQIDFGRTVTVDEALIFLRADFPHDNWWKNVTLAFSDGSSINADLRKTGDGQTIRFEAKQVSWVTLQKLVKDPDDPSPFPALAQLMVFGK